MHIADRKSTLGKERLNMWWSEALSTMVGTGPIHTALTGGTLVAVATLVMYISAKANATTGYETRRSVQLLEAAIREGTNRRSRELAKSPSRKRVVYLGDDGDCQWWTDRFSVSLQALRAAVQLVGPMAADIERHLRITGR